MKQKALLVTLAFLLAAGFASAELVSVGQGGYHPDSFKQLISYTSESAGEEFTIYDASTDAIVYTGTLTKATNFDGTEVVCQGNNPCLVGDFTDFTQEGTYYATTSIGGSSKQFSIDATYSQNLIPLFDEFFQALKQQDSPYHADFHTGYEVDFSDMADGSYIMVADQATQPLIRLANAYNHNPELVEPLRDEIIRYTEFLKSLQGRMTEEQENGTVRLDSTFTNNYAFTPGTPTQESVDVYLANGNFLETLEVQSLCGDLTGSDYDSCIQYAADFYKCQEDEICLDREYVGSQGIIKEAISGWGVSEGWGYEFGCYHDFDLQDGTFQGKYDPCMIFYPDEQRKYTAEFMYGMLLAVPAAYDTDPALAEEYVQRAVDTNDYFTGTYAPYEQGDADVGWYGAALFKLYDYTGEQNFLEEAVALRPKVSTNLIADNTRAPEFYWSEFTRHKQDIQDAGLDYGSDPAELFRGKMFFDWKDAGPTKISNNAERVFQFDNNIQFQNSRYMLTEAVIAAKTLELHPSPPSWTDVIADQQLAWLTGQNGVQLGVGANVPIVSLSFIFGVGDFPDEQHSRLYMNSGYYQATSGDIVGARGTGLRYDNGTQLRWLDGRTDIMGTRFGSFGNGYDGENQTSRWDLDQTFTNGAQYIPGWINGAFDVNSDTDIIFNYRDTVNTYENTETTNEIIATAIELLALRDAQLNAAPPHPGVPSTYPSTPQQAQLTINVTPEDANITVKGPENLQGTGDQTLSIQTGDYTITASYGNESSSENITVYAGQSASIILAVQLPQPEPVCIQSVHDTPASCSAAITTDTTEGVCRRVICESAQGSINLLACDKPSTQDAEYFEMYRQDSSGTIPELCLGDTCIQYSGYAKSENFGVCEENQTAIPPSVTQLLLKDSSGIESNVILGGSTEIDLADYNSNLFILEALTDGNVSSVELELAGAIIEDITSPYTLTEPLMTGEVTARALAMGPAGSDEVTISFSVVNTTTTGNESEDNQTTCYADVRNMPITCVDSEKTQDFSAGCRHVTCSGDTGSVAVLACNKPDNSNPEYFELYKQSSSGYGVDVCFGDLCLEGWGYKQSSNFPICTGETPEPETGSIESFILFDPAGNIEDTQVSGDFTVNTNTYTDEIGIRIETSGDVNPLQTRISSSRSQSPQDTVWNLTTEPYELTFPSEYNNVSIIATPFGPSGQGETQTISFSITEDELDTSAELTIAPWYPQETHTVLYCNEQGFAATSYTWDFGDGSSQTTTSDNVYHIYPSAGTYQASCVATDGSTNANSNLEITIQ